MRASRGKRWNERRLSDLGGVGRNQRDTMSCAVGEYWGSHDVLVPGRENTWS